MRRVAGWVVEGGITEFALALTAKVVNVVDALLVNLAQASKRLQHAPQEESQQQAPQIVHHVRQERRLAELQAPQIVHHVRQERRLTELQAPQIVHHVRQERRLELQAPQIVHHVRQERTPLAPARLVVQPVPRVHTVLRVPARLPPAQGNTLPLLTLQA